MKLLFSILLEYYTSVVTAETKGVAKCSAHLTLLCCVECEVEIIVNLLILIAFLVVDCWRDDVVLNSQNGSHCLYSTSSAEQWPVIDFVEEILSLKAASPKTSLMALASEMSPTGVDVP